MPKPDPAEHFHFPDGAGEMSELIRNLRWQDTILGESKNWSNSLRNIVLTILHSKFPMFIFWGPDHISFYNDAYRPSLGNQGKHPAALGMRGAQVFPEIWNDIKPLIDRVWEQKEAVLYEDLLLPIFRNNRIEDVYWTFCYSAAFEDDGTVGGVWVVCQETTEQVSAKRLLEKANVQLREIAETESQARKMMDESEMRFHMMAEATEILIAIGDETSNATYFNKAWTTLTGRTMDKLLKFGWVDLVHPDDKDRYVNLYLSAFKNLVPFTGEFRVKNIAGEYNWLLAKGNPRFRSDGSFAGYISNCIDISEPKQQQEILAETNARLKHTSDRLQLAIEAGELGLYEIDLIKGKINTSSRFDQIFNGISSTRWSDYVTILHPGDRDGRDKALTRAMETGTLDYSARLILDDKRIRWVMVKGKIMPGADGEVQSLLGIVQDVTHSRELEYQKDNFLGIASHELKTPVTSIKAYSQVMESMMEKAGQHKYADMMRRIDKQVNNLNSLITDLLDVSKMNSGQLTMNISRFDFQQLVQEIAEDMQRVTASHEIFLELAGDEIVEADRQRIGQVITNLVSNAIKYSPGANRINIYTKKEGEQVTLCVQDFGIGIAESKQGKVFEQFYRVSGLKEHTFPGLGLGLYISSEIVKRMGGRIWVNSIEGKGSTFCFSFPQVIK